MATQLEADVDVQRFGFLSDDAGKRLVFPRAQTHDIAGRSGATAYGAAECSFEGLEGRLDTLRWAAEAASVGGAYLRDDGERFAIEVDRAELPHGVRLVRGERGVELLSPHVSFTELKLTVKGPFGRPRAASAAEPASTAPETRPPPSPTRRQERLRFLDSLSGRIYLTIKVQLDLPVLGLRTLDQQLRVPIQEGSLDFRALEDSMNWLEGRFLDLEHDRNALKLQWKVPIFGASHELISWALDNDASTLASFGRVPARSLADFKLAAAEPPKSEDRARRKIVRAFALEAIDVALSLLAPRHLEAGGGVIMFGGDDQPGMVDLKVSGAIHDSGPGAVRGAIGSLDTTIKDLRVGPLTITADRLHFDGLDQLEVTFDGFRPIAVTMVVHRVTATNLALQIGGS